MLAAEFQPHDIFKPLLAERHVAVAVSGGSDSLALLLLASEFARNHDIAISALCFDHGLRAGSADEAAWVREFCATRGIACAIVQWAGQKPVTGIQALARTARYDGLAERCRAIGATALLTGHTADDQAETVFMRQSRTDSPLSLAAIWPQTAWNGVKILRTLLHISRADLRRFLQGQNVTWIEDPSNLNVVFERVRVRKQLAEQGVALPNLLHIAALSQSDVQRAMDCVQGFATLLTKDAYGVVRFSADAFLALDRLSRHLALRRAFTYFGMGQKVLKDEADRLLAWLETGPEKTRTLGGVVFGVKRGLVVMEREVGRIQPETLAHETGILLWDGRFMIPVRAGTRIVPVALLPRHDFARPFGLSANGFKSLPLIILVSGEVCWGLDQSLNDITANALETDTEVPM